VVGSRGDQLDHETAQRVPNQKRRPVQGGHECHQVVGVVPKAQRCDLAGAFVQWQFMMAQRRGMHRVATLLEGSPGGSPLRASAPRAVNQDNVPSVGHETKGDSQWRRWQSQQASAPLLRDRLVSGPPPSDSLRENPGRARLRQNPHTRTIRFVGLFVGDMVRRTPERFVRE
jgi:hypothetical protein